MGDREGVARKKKGKAQVWLRVPKMKRAGRAWDAASLTDQESVGDYCTTYMRATAPEGMRGDRGGTRGGSGSQRG